MDIIYFDLTHALKIHDYIIHISGGREGVKDPGQLESILDHIQNDWYYPDFEDKLTHLIFGVCKFHTFTDGNKRSAISLAMYFLEINGFDYCIDRLVIEFENIIVWLAENKISKELLRDIVYSIIYEYEFSEDLKLRILNSVCDCQSEISEVEAAN